MTSEASDQAMNWGSEANSHMGKETETLRGFRCVHSSDDFPFSFGKVIDKIAAFIMAFMHPNFIFLCSSALMLLISLRKMLSTLSLLKYWAFPLSQVPGPWFATWSRLWLWRTLSSGKAEQLFVRLSKKYGRGVPSYCQDTV